MTSTTQRMLCVGSRRPTRSRPLADQYRFDKKFKKRLKKKPKQQQLAILKTVEQLIDNPHQPGLHTSKLQGTKDIFYARINGGNRLTFHWEGSMIVFRNHCNHDWLMGL